MSFSDSEQSDKFKRLLVSQLDERFAFMKLIEVQATANMKLIRRQAELMSKLQEQTEDECNKNPNAELIRNRQLHRKRIEEFKALTVKLNRQLQRHEIESNSIMHRLTMTMAQLKSTR